MSRDSRPWNRIRMCEAVTRDMEICIRLNVQSETGKYSRCSGRIRRKFEIVVSKRWIRICFFQVEMGR